MHLHSLTRWDLEERVKKKVLETCFGFLIRLHERLINLKGKSVLPMHFLNVLGSYYNQETDCFTFRNKFSLDFGLEDILFITGLPIDGKPVTGIVQQDAVSILVKHLKVSEKDAKHLLKTESRPKLKGALNLEKLREHFESDEVRSTVDADIIAKAFILYHLGLIFFPTGGRTCQAYYLPLLDEVNNYAWGAAVLAHIKTDLAKQHEKKKTNICCYSLALMSFAFERFPYLTQGLVAPPSLPSELPLSLGWLDRVEYFKPAFQRKNSNKLKEGFENLTAYKIKWQPYSNRLQLPRGLNEQLPLKYAVVPCINFYSIKMVRPDLCYRQLGLAKEDVVISIPHQKISVMKPSGNKSMDLTSYAGAKKEYNYATLNDMWAARFSSLIVDYEAEQTKEQDFFDEIEFSAMMQDLELEPGASKAEKMSAELEHHVADVRKRKEKIFFVLLLKDK